MSRAAARSGRRPGEITLVAVSKTCPVSAIRAAHAAGLVDFGESRVQEAAPKIEALGDLPGIRWHFIGHLQKNKARRAALLFECVESVDSVELAVSLDRVGASRPGRRIPIFVQVELGMESGKFGFKEDALEGGLEAIRELAHLETRGLMAVPPAVDDPERARPFFARLRECRDRAHGQGLLEGRELSMGMSGDYEVAIEEGSTLVRVGTAIFGKRD